MKYTKEDIVAGITIQFVGSGNIYMIDKVRYDEGDCEMYRLFIKDGSVSSDNKYWTIDTILEHMNSGLCIITFPIKLQPIIIDSYSIF